MAITDPRAIKFSNEVIRPLAERMRDLKADTDAATVAWFATVGALVPNTSETLTDGRTAEGVSILTGADINGLVTQLLAYQTQLNANGVAAVVSKPCVRALVAR